jgi:hypothetical protein
MEVPRIITRIEQTAAQIKEADDIRNAREEADREAARIKHIALASAAAKKEKLKVEMAKLVAAHIRASTEEVATYLVSKGHKPDTSIFLPGEPQFIHGRIHSPRGRFGMAKYGRIPNPVPRERRVMAWVLSIEHHYWTTDVYDSAGTERGATQQYWGTGIGIATDGAILAFRPSSSHPTNFDNALEFPTLTELPVADGSLVNNYAIDITKSVEEQSNAKGWETHLVNLATAIELGKTYTPRVAVLGR